MPAPAAVLDRTELVVDNTDELPRDEWLEYRKPGLGGSDAAAVAGLDEYRTPMHVWEEKRGTLPESEVFQGNEKADWGHKLEPVLAAEFEARSGLEVLPANVLLRHPTNPFQLANVDRWVDDPSADHGLALLEIKTTGDRNRDDWIDSPPYRAAIQASHYLAVTGLSRAYIAVLIGGQEFRSFTFDRDDELIAALTSIEADFWDRVRTGTPPPVTARDKSLLTAKWEARRGSEVVVDEETVMEMLRRREQLITAGDLIAEERDQLENELRLMLGEHEVGVNANGKPLVTWKAQGKTGFNHKRCLEILPEAESFITKGTNRVLRVPGKIKKAILAELEEKE